jgi:TPR repeat protein
MRRYAMLPGATLTALLVLVAVTATAVAGPYEDGQAAADRLDYATALRLLRPLADQGNAKAQITIGWIYANGGGVPGAPENDAEAAKWWRLAADQGYAPAQNNLGFSYQSGRGVPRDYAEALSGIAWPQTKAMPRRRIA